MQTVSQAYIRHGGERVRRCRLRHVILLLDERLSVGLHALQLLVRQHIQPIGRQRPVLRVNRLYHPCLGLERKGVQHGRTHLLCRSRAIHLAVDKETVDAALEGSIAREVVALDLNLLIVAEVGVDRIVRHNRRPNIRSESSRLHTLLVVVHQTGNEHAASLTILRNTSSERSAGSRELCTCGCDRDPLSFHKGQNQAKHAGYGSK